MHTYIGIKLKLNLIEIKIDYDFISDHHPLYIVIRQRMSQIHHITNVLLIKKLNGIELIGIKFLNIILILK